MTHTQKRTTAIIEKICEHLVSRHFPPGASVAFPTAGTLEGLIGDNSKNAHAALMAFDSLAKCVERCNGDKKRGSELPLRINSVEAVDHRLRYSGVFTPTPSSTLGGGGNNKDEISNPVISDKPIEINVCFEASNKWPTDLLAIEAAETAMRITISKLLAKCR